MEIRINFETLPDHIKQWRKEIRLTQAQAAERLFISTAALNMYENGRRPLRMDEFCRIAKFYGYDVALLAVKQ